MPAVGRASRVYSPARNAGSRVSAARRLLMKTWLCSLVRLEPTIGAARLTISGWLIAHW